MVITVHYCLRKDMQTHVTVWLQKCHNNVYQSDRDFTTSLSQLVRQQIKQENYFKSCVAHPGGQSVHLIFTIKDRAIFVHLYIIIRLLSHVIIE